MAAVAIGADQLRELLVGTTIAEIEYADTWVEITTTEGKTVEFSLDIDIRRSVGFSELVNG